MAGMIPALFVRGTIWILPGWFGIEKMIGLPKIDGMTIELRFLAASVILGLIHLIVDSHLISFQYGYRWTASSREQPVPPLRGVANRVDQAYTNFMETFPFFAAVVLAAHLADRHGALTLWGVQLYFWGRLGYVLAAAAGFGLVRSMICFNMALTGIVLLLVVLLR